MPELNDDDLKELIGPLPKMVAAENVAFALPHNGREPLADLYLPPKGSLQIQHKSPDDVITQTLHVRMDAHVATYLENVLRAACDSRYMKAWLAITSKREWHQIVTTVGDHIWEEHTRARDHAREQEISKVRDYCFELIYRLVKEKIPSWDTFSTATPLWNRKRLAWTRLRVWMDEADKDESGNNRFCETTYGTYARLWLLCRRLWQSHPKFSKSDLAFLKEVSPRDYEAALRTRIRGYVRHNPSR